MALTITYDGKTPTLSWTPLLPFPSGYNVYWGPSPEGPWTKINVDLVEVTQYTDETHVITSGFRIYYKITAQVGGVEVDFISSQVWIPQARQGNVQRILKEINRRHTEINLDKLGGEDCTFYLRKEAGTTCRNGCASGDGFRHDHQGQYCKICYNTSIEGGYVALDVQIRVRNSQAQVELRQEGVVMTEGRTGYMGVSPLVNTGDFFVRPTGERYSIDQFRRRELQGYITLQVLTIKEIGPQHFLYGLTEALLAT